MWVSSSFLDRLDYNEIKYYRPYNIDIPFKLTDLLLSKENYI
jgi:hypothetical protein